MWTAQRLGLLPRITPRLSRCTYASPRLYYPARSHSTSNSTGMAPQLVPTSQPVVLCGPSGAGKSTLIKKLQDEFPGQYNFSVSRELEL
jgi:putative ribosome biogenesis GTPase RsgA